MHEICTENNLAMTAVFTSYGLSVVVPLWLAIQIPYEEFGDIAIGF